MEPIGKVTDAATQGVSDGNIAWVILVAVALLLGAAILAMYLWNVSRAKLRRDERDTDAPDIASYPAVKMLAATIERMDDHLKEHTAVTRDTAFSVERLTAILQQHSEVEHEEIREIRESQQRTENVCNNILRELDKRRNHKGG